MFLETVVSSSLIALSIFLVFAVFKDYATKWKKFKHLPGPPSWPLPLFGHTLRYRSSKDEFYSNLSRRLRENFIGKGHEVGCVWIGPAPVILVMGPNAAEVLLRSSKHMQKGFIYTFLHEWLGSGLLTSVGDTWIKRRKLLTPAFHFSISEYVWNRVRSPWLWWTPMYSITPTGRAYYKALNTLHGFTKNVIRDRIDDFNQDETLSKKKRLAFLDLLLRSSEGGKVLNFQDIQEEVDTFMFEGHDTTAAGMSWAVFLIGSNVKVQTKIQRELDAVLGPDSNRRITMDDLKKLEYLDLVLRECLRHLPSVPLIARTTSCDCTMVGYEIPAGTQCLLFPQLINNLERFWPEPDKFDPERFRTDRIAGQHPYVYIPFSAGPRNCIGQKFASMEEKVVLAHLLRKFSIKACDKREELKILGDLILRPGSGINVKLVRRHYGEFAADC